MYSSGERPALDKKFPIDVQTPPSFPRPPTHYCFQLFLIQFDIKRLSNKISSCPLWRFRLQHRTFPETDFFPLPKRLLRPAFSDYAHFSFPTFFVLFFQCAVKYPSTPYLHVTLPILHLGYSGRFVRPIVCA